MRHFDVPIHKKSFMFGHNKFLLYGSYKIQSKLHKRHTVLSCHRVGEAVATKINGFFYIIGASKPADILNILDTLRWAMLYALLSGME